MEHREFLAEADDILAERGQQYGGVEESFTRAAQLATLKLNKTVTAYDVATILESVKDARLAVNPDHFDSHVDGINYRAFRGEFSGAVKGTKTPAVPSPGVMAAAATPRADMTFAYHGAFDPNMPIGAVALAADPAIPADNNLNAAPMPAPIDALTQMQNDIAKSVEETTASRIRGAQG